MKGCLASDEVVFQEFGKIKKDQIRRNQVYAFFQKMSITRKWVFKAKGFFPDSVFANDATRFESHPANSPGGIDRRTAAGILWDREVRVP